MQMTKYSLITLLTLLGLACYAYARPREALRVSARARQDVEVWVEQNYVKVLDAVLPNEDFAVEKFPENIRWVASVRIVPSYDDFEFKFSLQRAYDGRVVAYVSAPQKVPIKAQVRELKRDHPNATLEEIIKLISVQHWTLTQERCPQLSQSAKQFESVKVSPSLNDELMLDAVSYSIWSQAQWGDRMQVRLRGPGPKARKQSYPLLQWAETFRSASKECMAKAQN